jgi:hypothetical protein
MIVVPVARPVTTPELAETPATPGAELVHTPPDTAVVRDTEEPTHKLELPEIAAGNACTVTILVTAQPDEVL